MSLYHSWQQSRHQRQQAVSGLLAKAKQQRQTTTDQLRDDLSLFREMLNQQNQARRANSQRFQADLQQFKARLQADTLMFLTEANTQRQADAQELAQELAAFVDSLRAEVTTLRQNLQSELAEQKADTQQLLADSHEQRTLAHWQTMEDLAEFMEGLRSDVQAYLTQVRSDRQEQAIALHNQLAQSRAERTADMQAMFSRLATFRSELNQFHTDLHQRVWGNAQPTAASKSAQPAQVPGKPRLTRPVATKPVTTTVNKPAGFAAKPSKPAAARSLPTIVPSVGAFQHGSSVAVVPVPPKDGLAYEKEVYNHIHKMNGARLTEIETCLGINRIQAVDALRSLIKKGLITQRDRVYLTQEPVHS